VKFTTHLYLVTRLKMYLCYPYILHDLDRENFTFYRFYYIFLHFVDKLQNFLLLK